MSKQSQKAVIIEHLERLLSSPQFADANRQQRFLRYIVEQSLAGASKQLKGYTIGVEVFDRPVDFDPGTDAIVRVEAGRLRSKLREYYDGPGRHDPIRFGMPKGSYALTFEDAAPETESRAPRGMREAAANSVAVLPIVSLSSDPAHGFFADGLTDALINRLGCNAALRVTSFTSIMRYKGSDKSLPEIGRELGVKFVVEGTYLPAGTRGRITAQLIDAATDTHVWAESYDRDLSNMLDTQDEVTGCISAAMGPALRYHTDAGIGKPIHPAAFEANLQGRRYRMQLTEEALKKAVVCFERAIELEPEFGDPYAGVAGCYCCFGTYGLELRAPHEVLPQGIKLAEKAIRLNESIVEGHAFLGIMKMKYQWDWPGARAEFERALSINPSDLRALLQYGLYFESIGDTDTAIDYAERAYTIDPFNKGVLLNRAWQYHQAGEEQRALGSARQLVETEADFWGAHWVTGHILRSIGRYDEARDAFAKADDLPGGLTLPTESLGHCRAVMGDEVGAREVLARLEDLAARTYVPPYRMATVFAGLNEPQPMYAQLERAFEARSRSLAWLGVAQEYQARRGDAQFKDLIRRIGIPMVAAKTMQ